MNDSPIDQSPYKVYNLGVRYLPPLSLLMENAMVANCSDTSTPQQLLAELDVPHLILFLRFLDALVDHAESELPIPVTGEAMSPRSPTPRPSAPHAIAREV